MKEGNASTKEAGAAQMCLWLLMDFNENTIRRLAQEANPARRVVENDPKKPGQPSDNERKVRFFTTCLYRVFREFYDIDAEFFPKIMNEPEKIIAHDVLDVLRMFCADTEQQGKLVHLVTTCTKFLGCGESLRAIGEMQA